MARHEQRGTPWRELPADYFWRHFPPSYHRDPDEELEAIGYDIDDDERAESRRRHPSGRDES